MPARLFLGEGELRLALKGHPDFPMALDMVKAVPGRRFDGDTKDWVFPDDPAVAERLLATIKPEPSPELLSWIKSAKAAKQGELISPLPDDAETLVPWGSQRVYWQPEKVGRLGEEVDFNGLFAHQRVFAQLAADRVSVLLADDMGLGKCAQAFSAVTEYQLAQTAFADVGIPPEVTFDQRFNSAMDMLEWADAQDAPKLVIAPSTVKGTWGREVRLWMGQNIPHQVVDGSTAKTRTKQITEGIAGNAWVIVNWEQLRVKKEKKKTKTKIYDPMTGEVLRIAERTKEIEVMREPLFETTPWVAAIADEAHRAKNRKSLQTKGLWRVDANMKLALTGTPLMNTPDELWAILKWLFPKEYTSYWRFFDQYVDYYEGNFGKIITGVKNADALRFELKDRLVRRTKKDVLDLPEKVRQYVPVTMGAKQKKLYEEAEKQLWFEVEQDIKAGDQSAIQFAKTMLENPNAIYTVANGATRLVRLRQILSSPALLGGPDESAKLDAIVEDILDAQKQIVVWTEFVGTTHLMVTRLEKHGIRAVSFTGELTSGERTAIEDKFQQGEIDVIIGTIAAMKEGITLTASNQSDWVERSYVPAVNEQGEDRQHRIGQTEPVLVKIFEVEGSIDTASVAVRNAIKSLIVEAVVKKDHVEEIREYGQELAV